MNFMVINLGRCFQQSNTKINKYKLWCRKLLGYIWILKIYCIYALACPNLEGQPEEDR